MKRKQKNKTHHAHGKQKRNEVATSENEYDNVPLIKGFPDTCLSKSLKPVSKASR